MIELNIEVFDVYSEPRTRTKKPYPNPTSNTPLTKYISTSTTD